MDESEIEFFKKTESIFIKSTSFISRLENNFKNFLKAITPVPKTLGIDNDILEDLKRISSSENLKDGALKRAYTKKETELPADWHAVDERLGDIIVKSGNRLYWENKAKSTGKIVPTSYDTLPPEYSVPHGLNLLGGKIVIDKKSSW